MLANGNAAGKSNSNKRKRIVDEPIVVNSVHDVGSAAAHNQHNHNREEKNSSIHRRKDIDSDNKSEVSYDDHEQAEVRSGIRKRK